MGVDAVVIIQNSRGITLNELVRGMIADPWGKRYALKYSKKYAWRLFKWEDASYFSLVGEYPRYACLFEYEFDFERDEEYPNPRFSYVSQVAFCKAMYIAEKLAGGPIFLGNDVIHARTPDRCLNNEEFTIPFEMDGLLKNWRIVAELPITTKELFELCENNNSPNNPVAKFILGDD